MKIELIPPIKPFDMKTNVSQLFGVNNIIYEDKFGIPGHNATDLVVRNQNMGYGESILAMHDGTVEKIVYDTPHHTRGNGIYLRSEDGIFSTIYWHLSGFQCNIGDKVKAGQAIGLMGNSGFVLPAPTSLCPRCGTHIHAGLLRNDIQNEYGGFIDPIPYLYKIGDKLPIKFIHDLLFGSTGDDVSWFQTILKIEFSDIEWQPIGIFGEKTLTAAKRFQERYGVIPAKGYVGPKTRSILNTMYT